MQLFPLQNYPQYYRPSVVRATFTPSDVYDTWGNENHLKETVENKCPLISHNPNVNS